LRPFYFFCFALFASCAAAAQDLHLQPVGTRVAKQFSLGPSIFYLPEGEWVLAARQAWTGSLQYMLEGPKFAGVLLFDVRGQQVARAIWVRTNIEPVPGARGWVKEEDPCKERTDLHLHRELGENYLNQYCVQVNHRVPFLVERKDWTRDAAGWLADNKLAPPKVVVAVQFARIDRAYNTQLHYYFNPEADGLAGSAATKWNASEWHRNRVGQDPARAAYVQALVKWAGDAAAPVYAGFTDAKLKAVFPQPPFPAK
jgi:hypothetical protein